MRETLGNRMSKKLKEYGISQRSLATLTHTTEVSVSRYVNDKRIPKSDVLYRIACALHTTTDYLLGLTTSEQTNEEYLKSLDTEQFAEWIAKCIKDTIILTHGNRKYTDNIVSTKWWTGWLKQPHQKE